MKTKNKDLNLLKSIADSLINEIENALIFFANIKDNTSVNYICKSNSTVKAGELVKMASLKSDGNGGGNPKFAQGGEKEISNIDKILEEIKKVIKENE